MVGSKLSNDEYRECGGAGQKKIGKIRQQSCSFTQMGGGRFLLKLFSSISSEIKRKLAQQLFCQKELAGSLSQAFFPPISTVFRKVLTSDFYFFKTIPRHSWMQFSLARILFCCCWCWCGGRPQHTKQPLTNCCCCCCLFGRRHESSPIRRRSGTCSSGPDCCCGGGR